MKKCSKCQKEKSNSSFNPDKRNKSGLQSQCKECQNSYQKLHHRRYVKKQIEWQRKKRKEYKDKYGLGAGIISRYGFRTALFVYDKAGRKCEKCENENDLTIHHLNGKGRHYQEKGGESDNDVKNLVVWCRKCHGSFHGKQGKGIKKS